MLLPALLQRVVRIVPPGGSLQRVGEGIGAASTALPTGEGPAKVSGHSTWLREMQSLRSLAAAMAMCPCQSCWMWCQHLHLPAQLCPMRPRRDESQKAFICASCWAGRTSRPAGRLGFRLKCLLQQNCTRCVKVSTSLESSRESRTAQLPGGPAKLHHRVLDALRIDLSSIVQPFLWPWVISHKYFEEWSTHGENKPVQLGRLQHMPLAANDSCMFSGDMQPMQSEVIFRLCFRLCVHIPRVRQWLRRAKGVLWVAAPC